MPADKGFPITVYENSVSGYKLKIEVWSEKNRSMRITVDDHLTYLRFMHTYGEDQEPTAVFSEVITRIRCFQSDYAKEQLLLWKLQGKDKLYVH